MKPTFDEKIQLLIIGGGFAGLSCFQAFDRRKGKVCLLTNRNHFLFTPLLPLAATGVVEVRSIVEPLHSFEKSKEEIIIGTAVDLDPLEKKVIVEFSGKTSEIKYETLALAMGAAIATFNVPGVEEHCLFLKEMKDARELRERVLFQFEKAAHLGNEAATLALTFIFVGGGPTGVETACEVYDLIAHDLRKFFPKLTPLAKIQIIEARKEILSIFDKTLVRYAERKLKQKNIQVLTGRVVSEVEKDRLRLADGEILPAETIIWTAGLASHLFTQHAAARLGIALNKEGRIPVNTNLTVGAFKNVYAMGDCAAMDDGAGHSLPATAQVAMKQGAFIGKVLSNKNEAPPFHFKSMGMLASLGGGAAIAELGNIRFKGLVAMWFWKAAYLTRLISLRNKISVFFDWIKVIFFGRNTARIDF